MRAFMPGGRGLDMMRAGMLAASSARGDLGNCHASVEEDRVGWTIDRDDASGKVDVERGGG